MKIKLLAFSLLSGSTFLLVGSALTSSASAQCVMADISVQYNISGSRRPTDRTNDVRQDSNGKCSGNAVVTTGVQGNVGGRGRVEQRRTVRQQINGSNSGIGGEPVKVRVNVPIDVYNPADNLRY